MKKILMGVISAAVALAGLVAVPVMAEEALVPCPKGSARYGESAKSYAECNLTKTSTNLWDSVDAIITTIIGVLGIVAVVVIILGGTQYVLSQGDPGKVKKAKDTIMYGVIGLVVALLAFAIVNFVLASVFGGGSSGGSDDSNTDASQTTTVTNNTNNTNNSGNNEQ